MWGIIPAAGNGTRIQPLAFSKELLGTPRARPLDRHMGANRKKWHSRGGRRRVRTCHARDARRNKSEPHPFKC